MKYILVIMLFSVLTLKSQAAEKYEFYNSVRSLGMGGARIAVVNDETSLIINPAGLGRLRDYYGTIIDPEVEYGTGTEMAISTDIMAGVDPQRGLNALTNTGTTRSYTRVQVFPSIVLPNFGFGVLGKYRMSAEISGADYNLNYENDFAAIVGFNFRLFDGRMKLGFNTKVINRAEMKGTFSAAATGLSMASDGKEGLGVGMDLGMLLTAPWKSLPTLAVVARDFGDTSFTTEGMFNTTATKPDTIPQTYDVGLAISPILGKRTRSTFSIEARDVLNMSGYDDVTKLYHFGSEFNFYDAIFLRFGYHQRYWTAGMEFAVNNVQLQCATYSEELGTGAVKQEERRYVFKFAYRF